MSEWANAPVILNVTEWEDEWFSHLIQVSLRNYWTRSFSKERNTLSVCKCIQSVGVSRGPIWQATSRSRSRYGSDMCKRRRRWWRARMGKMLRRNTCHQRRKTHVARLASWDLDWQVQRGVTWRAVRQSCPKPIATFPRWIRTRFVYATKPRHPYATGWLLSPCVLTSPFSGSTLLWDPISLYFHVTFLISFQLSKYLFLFSFIQFILFISFISQNSFNILMLIYNLNRFFYL